jgi:uncharacterized protein
MVYLDTSVLVALLTNEPAAGRVTNWLKTKPTGTLHISGWVIAEFSSALSLKVRTGQINLLQRDTALTAFNRLVARSLISLPVGNADYPAAARLCDRLELGLRAADSLHLVVALNAGLPMATLDSILAKACTAVGLPVEMP